MKKHFNFIAFIICLIIFITISILVINKKDLYLDTYVYNLISVIITPINTQVLKSITFLGSAIVVIGITILCIIFIKNKRYGIFMSIDLVSITIFQLILKNIFCRNRPVDINLIVENSYSYPSGHCLTAMAFYGLIIYFIIKSNIPMKNKKIYSILLSILILFIGLSRIYLGVHFFTDVIGGYTFSVCFLIIYTYIIKRWLI